MSDEQWMEQVMALREQIAREIRAAQDGVLREQTAATILAALIAKGRSLNAQGPDDMWGCRSTTHEAVMLTDMLRAELAKGGGK